VHVIFYHEHKRIGRGTKIFSVVQRETRRNSEKTPRESGSEGMCGSIFPNLTCIAAGICSMRTACCRTTSWAKPGEGPKGREEGKGKESKESGVGKVKRQYPTKAVDFDHFSCDRCLDIAELEGFYLKTMSLEKRPLLL
jgi:hypothetical protein